LLHRNVGEVADIDALGRDLDLIVNAHTASVLKPLAYLQPCCDAHDLRKHSSYLLSRSREVKHLLDANHPLRHVLSAQIKIKQFAIGDSLALTGILSYALLQTAGVHRAMEASLKMGTKWLLLPAAGNFVEEFLIEIRDVLIAEIGETALEEFLGWRTLVVIPLLGQALAILPVIRYARLWHRVFIQQTPLLPLKQKIREECRRLIEEMRQDAKRNALLQIKQVHEIVEGLDYLKEDCDKVQHELAARA
jgi:hypothetical protein